MKRYLLDTCICVFLFRQKYGIAERLDAIGASECFVSEVTIAELTYGAYKSNRVKENLELLERFVRRVNIVPFADSIDFFAQEKNRLRTLGIPIDDFDLLIAASAYANNLVLVTDNLKHFQNIKGLMVENWVKR